MIKKQYFKSKREFEKEINLLNQFCVVDVHKVPTNKRGYGMYTYCVQDKSSMAFNEYSF